ncbi:hypothetical protein [Ileibacterium valens]|uniref:hypothetical protein n=1 Tax=Ileibacterium valens TaxID=1862668 RepID=UPI00259B368D|nr:hypothetical protein [Ileibacterium valens]
MMKFKTASCLVSASMALGLLAGCSSNSTETPKSDVKTDENQNTETNTNTTNTDAENNSDAMTLIDAIKNASDDDAGLEAWENLLIQSVKSTDYNFELETDGEDYAYNNEDPEGNVDEDAIYEVGAEGWFISKGEEDSYFLNLTTIDGSDDNYLEGFGTIDYINPKGTMITVKLTDSKLDDISGKVEQISDNGGDMSMITRDSAALNLVMDSIVNVGYLVNADPFHNTTLYSYEVTEDNGSYVLKAAIKDPKVYIQAASNKALLYSNRTSRPSLGIDELKDETWEFHFNKDGVLSSVITNIDHVLYQPNAAASADNPTYLAILNKTEFKKADESELDVNGIKNLCASAIDGSLTENSDFSLKDE